MAAKKKQERPKQERGKRTHETLLLAAIESLVENHIYGLRFAQISKIAGVPQPLMDYHFPSLEALLMEMITYQLEKLKMVSIEAIQQHATKPRKALEAYIRATFLLGERDEGFRAVYSSYNHLATVNKTFADFNRTVRKTGNERLGTLVGAIAMTENLQNASDAKAIFETATAVQGILSGFALMVSAETGANYKQMADLAVKAAFQVLAANFPSKA